MGIRGSAGFAGCVELVDNNLMVTVSARKTNANHLTVKSQKTRFGAAWDTSYSLIEVELEDERNTLVAVPTTSLTRKNESNDQRADKILNEPRREATLRVLTELGEATKKDIALALNQDLSKPSTVNNIGRILSSLLIDGTIEECGNRGREKVYRLTPV